MNSKNQPNTVSKMRVLFADDELPAREKLSHQLSLMEHVYLTTSPLLFTQPRMTNLQLKHSSTPQQITYSNLILLLD